MWHNSVRKLLNMCLNCLETKIIILVVLVVLIVLQLFTLSFYFYLKQNNEFWWLRICYLTQPKQDSLFKVIIAWHSFLFLCFTLFKVDISWRIAFEQKNLFVTWNWVWTLLPKNTTKEINMKYKNYFLSSICNSVAKVV